MERESQEERIERYALGDFGDARLKKRERNCMRDWSVDKTYACDSLAETVRGKFVSDVFWPTRA
jgi:hypothetical protein